MKPFSCEIKETDIFSAGPIIYEHMASLPFKADLFWEDLIRKGDISEITTGGKTIGYFSISSKDLVAFYVTLPYFKYGPGLLEDIITHHTLDSAFISTYDTLFQTLLSEWKTGAPDNWGFQFIDNGRQPKPWCAYPETTFRVAGAEDKGRIETETEHFFEPEEYETFLPQGKIFMLEANRQLLGCGLYVESVLKTNAISVGMVTCRSHRKSGVGQTILWHLKELVYEKGGQPVAGCWFYNTLSRKTLQSAGMIPAGMLSKVSLLSKEHPPVRTGNPPGELVEPG